MHCGPLNLFCGSDIPDPLLRFIRHSATEERQRNGGSQALLWPRFALSECFLFSAVYESSPTLRQRKEGTAYNNTRSECGVPCVDCDSEPFVNTVDDIRVSDACQFVLFTQSTQHHMHTVNSTRRRVGLSCVALDTLYDARRRSPTGFERHAASQC